VAHLLSSLGAKVVVAAHPTDFIVTEDAMTIAIILSVAGLGFLCWLAFNLAVHALPFFAGVAAGLFAYHTGAGPIGTIALGLIAGAATLVIGQFIFATIRSPLPRALMTAAFALPAAVAGYHLVLGLSAIGMASDPWRHVFAVIGAIMVGSTAWARLVAHPFEKPERAAGSGLQQS
jgi:hypothetical protein